MKRWRPTPFLLASMLLHGVAMIVLLAQFALWPWAVAALLANHACLCMAGLWPRSKLLGPNIDRLPIAAAQRNEVAITIDDGPDPIVTPHVLEILATHGAKASFFCIGERAAAHPELIHAIVAAGHSVENHGQRHRNHVSLSGPAGWLREVGEAQTTLTRLAGEAPRYFRALAGLRNPFLDPVLHTLGLELASWSRRGYDTRCGESERVLQRLVKGLAAGSILLLHDGHAARTPSGVPVILEVLPRLLETLSARKLHPVTLRSACSPL